MTHLTITGMYAGQTLCGARHVDNPQDQYLHAMYAPIEKLERNEIANFSPLCKECLKVWNDPEL